MSIMNIKNDFETIYMKTEDDSIITDNTPQKKKQQRTCLSIEKRAAIIERLENGELASDLADEYGVTKPAISQIKKRRNKILYAMNILATCQGNTQKKRYRGTEEKPFERKLFSWYLQQQNLGIPVSGTMLRKQALSFNSRLGGKDTFKASDGWLDSFKHRHEISLGTIRRKLHADPIANEEYREQMDNLMTIADSDPNYIYNCHGTELFWKIMPNQYLDVATENEKWVKIRKKPKNRLTIAICTNASGTHKIPLFIIGKPKEPHCLRNVDDLEVVYEHEKNSNMTKELMMKWYTSVFIPEIKKSHDLDNIKKNNKIILTMDKASYHPSADEFNSICANISVILLPSNVSSFIQPMSQGIIERFKKHYRNLLLNRTLVEDTFDDSQNFYRIFNLLDCCKLCGHAWNEVSPASIRSCWQNIVLMDDDDNDTLSKDIEPIDATVFHSLVVQIPHMSNLTLQDIIKWLDIDSDKMEWQRDIDKETEESSNESGSDVIEELDDTVPLRNRGLNSNNNKVENTNLENTKISAEEACNALKVFQQWYQSNKCHCASHLSVLQKCYQFTVQQIEINSKNL